MNYINIFQAAFIGYFCGSIPFGVIVSRLFKLGDLTRTGSGNIGATNVLRLGNKPLAALTLLFDAAKGYFAIFICNIFSLPLIVAAIAAVVGHIFPIWLKFRGGKGVATFLGVTLFIDLLAGGLFVICWLLAAIISRFSSLSALFATMVTTLYFIAFYQLPYKVGFIIMTAIIWWRHRSNISRLIQGNESRIGQL